MEINSLVSLLKPDSYNTDNFLISSKSFNFKRYITIYFYYY